MHVITKFSDGVNGNRQAPFLVVCDHPDDGCPLKATIPFLPNNKLKLTTLLNYCVDRTTSVVYLSPPTGLGL
jgi:hypothetical protein